MAVLNNAKARALNELKERLDVTVRNNPGVLRAENRPKSPQTLIVRISLDDLQHDQLSNAAEVYDFLKRRYSDLSNVTLDLKERQAFISF